MKTRLLLLFLLLLLLVPAGAQNVIPKKAGELTRVTIADPTRLIVLSDPAGILPPTTIAAGDLAIALMNGLTISNSTGTLTIANGKTFTATNSINLAGTDNSTLNVGTGGTLGTAAYTAATAYQPADADLTTFAGITPSANVQTLLGSANYAAFRSSLSLGNVENTALSTWAGSNSITTLGTITTGTWQGTAIADGYISSASAWNAKQAGSAVLTALASNSGSVNLSSLTLTLPADVTRLGPSISLTSEVTGTLPVASGGTGTTTPSLVAGNNISVTGTWPNQTVAATAAGGFAFSSTTVATTNGTTTLSIAAGKTNALARVILPQSTNYLRKVVLPTTDRVAGDMVRVAAEWAGVTAFNTTGARIEIRNASDTGTVLWSYGSAIANNYSSRTIFTDYVFNGTAWEPAGNDIDALGSITALISPLGNDAKAQVGDSSHPFRTLQAALDAGAPCIHVLTGCQATELSYTGTRIGVVVVSEDHPTFGTIAITTSGGDNYFYGVSSKAATQIISLSVFNTSTSSPGNITLKNTEIENLTVTGESGDEGCDTPTITLEDVTVTGVITATAGEGGAGGNVSQITLSRSELLNAANLTPGSGGSVVPPVASFSALQTDLGHSSVYHHCIVAGQDVLTSATLARIDTAQTFSASQTFSAPLLVTNSTASSSTASGALIVSGGLGVGGATYAGALRVPDGGDITVGGVNGSIGFSGLLNLKSANGKLIVYNGGYSDAGMIVFGGTTSSYPGLKRSSTALQARLADDSGFAFVESLYQRAGSGSPEGVVTAPVGAIYHRTDGGAGTSNYFKESGSGNTGWVAK